MKEKILERKVIFNKARESVKNEFYGIDEQIDKIFDSISAWYLAPEILNRPTIVNLWGMTGVGKTSVIRKIVDSLNLSERYLELQMGEEYKNNLCEILQESPVRHEQHGVILLDEFQRFRKIDEFGVEIATKNPIDDIWMLLSDGRYPFESIMKSIMRLREIFTDAIMCDEYTKEYSGVDFGEKYKNSRGEERTLIRTRSDARGYIYDTHFDICEKFLPFTADEFAKFKFQLCDFDRLDLLNKVVERNTKKYIDYTKCLIFISGNLDEAFKVANDVNDCDTDADTYHDYTKKISISSIKKALRKRFSPEQIARMGNDHIIYPSLSKYAYQQIIKSTCENYIKDFEKSCGIKLTIDKSLYNTIYENSVYPTQGTRPVFSTISKIFTSPLSRGVLWAIENNYSECVVTLRNDPDALIFTKGDYLYSVPIQLDIADSRKRYSEDYSALVAVHEIGHALVYAELFKAAPRAIKINTASFTGGYNIMDSKTDNRKSILDNVAVMFGGIAAEEIIFGSNNRSEGCGSDLSKATSTTSNFVRNLGMNGINGVVQYEPSNSFIRQTDESDLHIEEILNEAKDNALNILNKHKNLIIELSKELLVKKDITKEEFSERCSNVFEFVETSDDIHGEYHKILMSIK